MWIQRIKEESWSWDRIQERAGICGQDIASRGDVIQFKGKKQGETASAFDRLAEGLACASFAPGGVKFLGNHWESTYGAEDQPIR